MIDSTYDTGTTKKPQTIILKIQTAMKQTLLSQKRHTKWNILFLEWGSSLNKPTHKPFQKLNLIIKYKNVFLVFVLTLNGYVKNQDEVSPEEEQKIQEVMMIFYSNAIVNPRAMMIKPFYTSIADSTMPRSLGSNYLAVWAQLCRMHF